jgi:hypothetical protein
MGNKWKHCHCLYKGFLTFQHQGTHEISGFHLVISEICSTF